MNKRHEDMSYHSQLMHRINNGIDRFATQSDYEFEDSNTRLIKGVVAACTLVAVYLVFLLSK